MLGFVLFRLCVWGRFFLVAPALLLLLVALAAFPALVAMLMLVVPALTLLVFVLIPLAFLAFLLVAFASRAGSRVVLGLPGFRLFLGWSLALRS